MRVQGGALLKWRAFNEADLRSKSAQRAQICAPQGHASGGRQPDMHRVVGVWLAKKSKSSDSASGWIDCLYRGGAGKPLNATTAFAKLLRVCADVVKLVDTLS
ncbi:MAG: hypothetical protein HQM04_02835 [Magnetococcales bacterium]|nr:hypothetical protein [Magnetococcales bacterium]MBF0113958.1 hypothetical protein [Magnetococcales bacterium]